MIQSAHGIHLPPRKKKVFDKSLTVRFILTGTIPSKKNRQIAAINWKGIISDIGKLLARKGVRTKLGEIMAVFKKNKPFIRQSPDFREWNEAARQTLLLQAAKISHSYRNHSLLFPISRASVSIYHYWKDNLVRDNSNKAETIHDLLVDAHIISGDNWQCLSPIKADADIYTGEILDHITVIDLTAYEW